MLTSIVYADPRWKKWIRIQVLHIILQDLLIFFYKWKFFKDFFSLFFAKLKWTIQKLAWFWLVFLDPHIFANPEPDPMHCYLDWCTLYLDWCTLNRRRNDNHFLTSLQSQVQQYSWVLHGILQISILNQEFKRLLKAQN